ncbi:hypothetical protein POSPLADRAFT_1057292 [Postia placenta MAD-698-R-SB12]|uniref:CCHC-type domain-containing protein n=1 Tax=Postia placenta MAD-698-R-SB12 TaxID=670580 RepID=A0A1X6MYT5_9APHY|nr:hypothetical protein POSPLADRAFT_1057292 [Postia placenta MAD-698-R-SB12]OSX61517.1 hypothetical protein POSPLADRAFT_1057292 [Postia placenta MAD-698-R-SB12]
MSLLPRLDPPPQAPASPNLSPVQVKFAQPTATPQAIPQLSLGPQLERPPKTGPRDTPPHSWGGSLSVVTTSTSVSILRHPASGFPQSSSPPSPLRGRSSTRSSRSPPGGQSQQLPPSAGSPSSPSSPIMSSPAAVPNKETLKLLLCHEFAYDQHIYLQSDVKPSLTLHPFGVESVVECNCFISQLLIYWTINTALSFLELKIQVALSLLDGDARAWATPIFSQLASARFGNLDDAATAQVELTKLCADKTMREKRTAAEFLALFKGPADRSGYGNLELRNKYLGGIASQVYRKIELETFATCRARWPELNNFFSAWGRGRGGARGGAPSSHGASASLNAAVGKGDFPGSCFGCGKQGYQRFECPNCKDKPYTKRADTRATVASGSTQVATSAPIASSSASTSAASAKLESSELADLIAQMKSMREELEHYWAMKEESF